MDASSFEKCEICGSKIEFSPDSPLYCKKCIAEMEKRSLSPEQYKEYRELRETLK